MSATQRLTLLDLPAELRERIYIFTGIVASEPLSFSATTYQHPLSEVCHLIREEVLQLYYSRNRFALATHVRLKQNLEAIGDSNVSRIRRLRFNGYLSACMNVTQPVSVDVTLWPARPWVTVEGNHAEDECKVVRNRLTILEMAMTTQVRKALGRPSKRGMRCLHEDIVTGLVRDWHKLIAIVEDIGQFMDRDLQFQFKDDGWLGDDSDDLRNDNEDLGDKQVLGDENGDLKNKDGFGDKNDLEHEPENDELEDESELADEYAYFADFDEDLTDENLTNEDRTIYDFIPNYTEGGRVQIILDVENGIRVVSGLLGHGGETTITESMKMNSLKFARLIWYSSSKRPQVVLL